MEQFVNGLTDYQRAFLKKYPCPQLFYVVSWGCAATAWLARVLNRHPDIYCVHAANHLWHVLGNCQKVDGARYLQIIGSQGHAHTAAGGVHGMDRALIPECRRIFGKQFNAAVVVREPLARMRSQIALQRDFEGIPVFDLGYIDALAARAGFAVAPGDYEVRLFVHAANMLNAVLEEREVGKIYRAEDLTSDADVLGDFMEEITRGKISPDPGWLKAALETKRVNVHAGRYPPRELDDWQIDVIRRVVDPQAWDTYESLGYVRTEFAAGSAPSRRSIVA